MSDPIADALDNPVPAPVLAQPGDSGPQLGGGRYERPGVDPSCPVKCLGITSDIGGTQKCFYLNYNGQLVGLEAGNRHGKNSLIALFGPSSDWLEAHYPQWSKPVTEYDRSTKTHTVIKASEIVGFDQAEASRALIEECARRGIFDPAGRMRGAGAHRLTGGDSAGSGRGLVMHFGNRLLASDHRVDGSLRDWSWHEPGLHEGYVYPAARPCPRPWHEPCDPSAAERLLALYSTWNWKRPRLDPLFLIGFNVAAMLGGALNWRPSIWITGGRGTGKSTLNGKDQVLHQLHGDATFRTANASAAAIRQSLKNSTVPVFFDEIEASADNRRVHEVIDLMRIASSGDDMHRGGSDHQAHEFTLQSGFQFSSINIPPLEPSDRSRLAILSLMPLAHDAREPVLSDYNLPRIGRVLLRRAIDGWERLEPTLVRFKAALAMGGHDARGRDQFGALLACAHLALHDGLPTDELLADWCGLCTPTRMSEISETTADETACLNHILTSIQQARGCDEREALGTWIGRAATNATLDLYPNPTTDDRSADRLQQIGLKLINAVWHKEVPAQGGQAAIPGRWGASAYRPDQPGFLAVAGAHRGLEAVFQGSKWNGGVWRQALARTPHALDPVKVKFGKQSLTAVLVPLAAVLDESELAPASCEMPFAEWMCQVKQDGATW
jgi:hypothetical protein